MRLTSVVIGFFYLFTANTAGEENYKVSGCLLMNLSGSDQKGLSVFLVGWLIGLLTFHLFVAFVMHRSCI